MKVNVTIDIGKLPETGNDWELYTCSMKCERAAKALTAALKRAIRACGEGKTTYEAMKEHFDPVARKYSAYGAQDTEPMVKAEMILDRVSALTTRPMVR
jgi:hypothetical protein